MVRKNDGEGEGSCW